MVMDMVPWGWDKPCDVMIAEVKSVIKVKFWAADFSVTEREYCHIEHLIILDKSRCAYGFKVAVIPFKIQRGSAGWVKSVAIL
jgi:hypothetical protein